MIDFRIGEMVILDYGELFSCFGNQALDIIFNIDTSNLPEKEIQMLIALVIRMTHDERLSEEVTLLISEEDDEERWRKLQAFLK